MLVPSTRFGTLTSGTILNELKLWACFIEFTMAHCKVCYLVSFPSLPNTIHFHIQTSPTDCRSAGLISHSNQILDCTWQKAISNIINFLLKFAIVSVFRGHFLYRVFDDFRVILERLTTIIKHVNLIPVRQTVFADTDCLFKCWQNYDWPCICKIRCCKK